jgi:hypothetical protein
VKLKDKKEGGIGTGGGLEANQLKINGLVVSPGVQAHDSRNCTTLPASVQALSGPNLLTTQANFSPEMSKDFVPYNLTQVPNLRHASNSFNGQDICM